MTNFIDRVPEVVGRVVALKFKPVGATRAFEFEYHGSKWKFAFLGFAFEQIKSRSVELLVSSDRV
jgi:hypothetical protein